MINWDVWRKTAYPNYKKISKEGTKFNYSKIFYLYLKLYGVNQTLKAQEALCRRISPFRCLQKQKTEGEMNYEP